MKFIKAQHRLLLLIFISFIKANAQTSSIDSLERVLEKHTISDTTKVNLMNDLAYEVRNFDKKKTRYYADQAEQIANQIYYLKGKAASVWIKGITYWRTDNKLALDYFYRALFIAEKAKDKIGICNYLIAIGNSTKNMGRMQKSNEAYERSLMIARELKNKKLIIKTLVNVAHNYSRQSNHSAAVKALQEVILISKEIGDNYILAAAYDKMAVIYSLQGNYPEALEYILMALKINEQTNNEIGIITNLMNIAEIQSDQKDFSSALKTAQKAYLLSKNRDDSLRMSTSLTNIGNIYLSMNDSVATQYFQKSLAFNKERDLTLRVGTLTKLGTIYTDRKEFDKALKCLQEALIYAQRNHLTYSSAKVLSKIGILYFAQKQYSQAMNYTQQALILAKDANSLDIQRDIRKQFSDIYAATGDFNKAYLNHAQYKALYDSVFNKENIRKIAMLESSYEYAKERQIYETEKASHKLKIRNQKQIIVSLIVISVLVAILTCTIYWTNKLKKKVLRLEIENINRELENNQKAIAAATLKLVQNSERDANSVKLLENIEKNSVEDGQKEIRSLIADYKLKSYNSNWEEFEIMFEKIHASFYENLNKRFPNLTPNERKLCVFLKLNMSNNHISQITFQSEEALKKARLRLRKKLEIDRETNLSAFIQNI